MSLENFVVKAKVGSPYALDRLWSAVRPSVARWVGAEVRDADAAEDVIQGVLIQVWRRLVTFRSEGRFTSWLYVVTRNQIRMARRAEERHRRHRVEVSLTDLASACPEGCYLDGIVADKLVERISDAVLGLPVAQRQAFIEVDLHGWTPTEAAKELPMAPGVVRSNLCRARRQLRRHLERNLSTTMGHSGESIREQFPV